jgi:lipoic acid synthetase
VTFWKLYYAIRVLLVFEYVKPEKFDYFRQVVEEIVFKYMASGPIVQSSYRKGEFYWEHRIKLE